MSNRTKSHNFIWWAAPDPETEPNVYRRWNQRYTWLYDVKGEYWGPLYHHDKPNKWPYHIQFELVCDLVDAKDFQSMSLNQLTKHCYPWLIPKYCEKDKIIKLLQLIKEFRIWNENVKCYWLVSRWNKYQKEVQEDPKEKMPYFFVDEYERMELVKDRHVVLLLLKKWRKFTETIYCKSCMKPKYNYMQGCYFFICNECLGMMVVENSIEERIKFFELLMLENKPAMKEMLKKQWHRARVGYQVKMIQEYMDKLTIDTTKTQQKRDNLEKKIKSGDKDALKILNVVCDWEYYKPI